jgi:hypothetical protein
MVLRHLLLEAHRLHPQRAKVVYLPSNNTLPSLGRNIWEPGSQ